MVASGAGVAMALTDAELDAIADRVAAKMPPPPARWSPWDLLPNFFGGGGSNGGSTPPNQGHQPPKQTGETAAARKEKARFRMLQAAVYTYLAVILMLAVVGLNEVRTATKPLTVMKELLATLDDLKIIAVAILFSAKSIWETQK